MSLASDHQKSINKGHPAFVANIIKSHWCYSMNADTLEPLILRLSPPLQCQFYEKQDIHILQDLLKIILAKNILVFFLIIPPDEDNEAEYCMANELGHVNYLYQSGHSK